MRLSLATEPAYANRPNEDFIGTTSDAVVLLDGAGTPAGLKTGCSHGVAWYAHTLGSTLLAAVTQSSGALTEILAESIKNVASLHDFTCDLVHAGSPSATVSMVRRTGDVLEWLVLADSAVVLDTDTAEPTVICDDRVNQIGSRYRALMDSLPGGSPEHAEAFRGYVETLRDHRNRDGGFWVASVDPLAAEQALTGAVPVDQVRAVALLSDGATRLVDRFALVSWRQLLDILDQDGPDELICRVRQAEHSDPNSSRWPRGKVHDDATAALWKFP
ncbi:protein phosphatase 2C domain-containing protein [Streptosporangium sp. NPDC006930]|uniref:protein phosphatase 2C domain-containing protein n=1 Tax=Streptosporangium sp. NPDC006930 TaxID=3154783 RepID=UPI00343E9D9F